MSSEQPLPFPEGSWVRHTNGQSYQVIGWDVLRPGMLKVRTLNGMPTYDAPARFVATEDPAIARNKKFAWLS